jgi:hypothetical protein
MTISKKRKLLITHLDEHLALLHKSLIALDYSFDKCTVIGEKEEYDLEQQESFEALTSGFARTYEIILSKYGELHVTKSKPIRTCKKPN